MPRFVTPCRPISALHPITEFYRQELARHHRCLQQQRPYFSESAITDAEAALSRMMGELDDLCAMGTVADVMEPFLKQIDLITGLSSSTDSRHTH